MLDDKVYLSANSDILEPLEKIYCPICKTVIKYNVNENAFSCAACLSFFEINFFYLIKRETN